MVKCRLPILLKEELIQQDFNIEKSIVNVCKVLQESLNKSESFDTKRSGTTLSGVVIDSSTEYSFNIGDSRTVLAYSYKGQKTIKQLTIDHKVELFHEAARIYESGGKIAQLKDQYGDFQGPLRIWNEDYSGPGLAMSRSLGDQMAHDLGCSDIPDIN